MPYAVFREAGFEVHFATEKGVVPKCDEVLMTGWTRRLLVGFEFFVIFELMARGFCVSVCDRIETSCVIWGVTSFDEVVEVKIEMRR